MYFHVSLVVTVFRTVHNRYSIGNKSLGDIVKSILAQNIEKRKRDLGITTNIQLAKSSGVSRAVITNIQLQPEKSIMLDSGLMLARTLDCRVEWLATGEGPINLDDVERYLRVKFACPVLVLSEISKDSLPELLSKSIEDLSRERIPCPAGSNENRFVIRLSSDVGKYWAGGLMYFEYNGTPENGRPVIALMNGELEIMEYARAHGRVFLKSLNEDIPQELRFIEKTDDVSILASYVSFASN